MVAVVMASRAPCHGRGIVVRRCGTVVAWPWAWHTARRGGMRRKVRARGRVDEKAGRQYKKVEAGERPVPHTHTHVHAHTHAPTNTMMMMMMMMVLMRIIMMMMMLMMMM